jgi:hypothetical protein
MKSINALATEFLLLLFASYTSAVRIPYSTRNHISLLTGSVHARGINSGVAWGIGGTAIGIVALCIILLVVANLSK